MDEQEDGVLDPAAAAWVQDLADRHYEGNFGRAAAAILEAAYAAELAPDDPWAYLAARQHGRGVR
ncbi:hypothetical protein [Actinoplanes palleronii]|uniref:Uncharacterized protein n=1 Tax=Actinoplanes palleronii TaxID=113570 RepID=A0ABQ4BJ53_9ACTN|nr:hypothetical protein [Actinoplanes palleronii]GIE70717.1 hypothetical protein Apa02nite_068250 [Actinoplanes palleronii]